MISIPLPLVLTVLAVIAAVFTGTRHWLPGTARAAFTALAGLIATLTLMVTLRFAWDLEQVIGIQRVLPFFIGPLAWVGYLALSDRAERFAQAAWLHIGIALLAAVPVMALPAVRGATDFAIALSYAVYATALLRLWRGGPDRLSRVPIGHVTALRRLMLAGAGMLALTLVMDTAIAFDFARTGGENVRRLLSFASLLLIVLLLIAVVVALRGQGNATLRDATDADRALVDRAAACLRETRLFTDPELSLTRLARRIAVTDRALSEAVNRHTGANVSQFINGFRVAEAADLLRSTRDPVMRIGEQAGFLTRSNFYAEFQRVHGISPGAWRKTESTV
ncbi:AraC family transcriptional regulator [uncultured Roseobacter sp.]|uniref:helix-turn-helix domain-containing protein n=1 Tax=uncultured Roseobacter sp. TaxID=114847 RepID=UPI0026141C8F|nr:AraC family transcriptional regulator [uncultured Roseobacter sp.]